MDLKYPIGKLNLKETITDDDVKQWINEISLAPVRLKEAVVDLTDSQLNTPYRPEGWTIRQVVHHVFDSHMNAYTRFKLGLTEDTPTIRPYDEARWAELEDSKMPIDVSINLVDSLHLRLVTLLESLNEAELKRKIIHPDSGSLSLEQLIATYAWHGNHHIAHITNLCETMGWKRI